MRKRDRSSEEKHFDAMLKSGLMRLGEHPSVTLTGKSSEVTEPRQSTNPFPYVLVWDRGGRKGQKLRVINPKPKSRLVQVEFEDGLILTLDRQAIRQSS
jgi:hypothetical protein